jgi:hypothetical protein
VPERVPDAPTAKSAARSPGEGISTARSQVQIVQSHSGQEVCVSPNEFVFT